MPICLESATMEQSQAGIALSVLPQTFRDAISVVRSAGQKYLWIDSLCIIQDSSEDWAREAMQMGSIYDGAWCTIAATRARDSTEGCFVARDPRLLRPCTYEPPPDLRSPKLGNGPVYIVNSSLWISNVDKAPLNSRAWVIQERLLSPRIIHFGAQQVFWECQELAACESFPAGLPEDIIEQVPQMPTRSFNSFKRLLAPFPDVVRGAIPPPFLAYEAWCEIIAGYTKCGLTQSKDKLVAIAGIAKRLQPYLNDAPCAGFWRKSLAHGLAWTWARGGQLYRPDTIRAPSWSWASVEGPVEFNLHKRWNVTVEVVSCDAPTKDGSGFGELEVGNAHLTLRGQLQPVQWERQETMPFMISGVSTMITPWTPKIGRVEFPWWDITWDNGRPTTDGLDEPLRNTLFVVPLGWSDNTGPRQGVRVVGLLLQKQNSSVGGAWYERVGLLNVVREKRHPDLDALFRGSFYSFSLK